MLKSLLALILAATLLTACVSAGAQAQGGNRGSRASVGGTIFKF